jgi:alpha-1,2-mannosyltransferase
MIKIFLRTVFSFVKGVVYTSLVVSFVITVPIIIGVLLLPKDESEDNVTATRNFPFIGINILPSKDGQWKKVKTRTGVIVYVPGREAKIKKLIKDNKETVKIAFFHPFCYTGGGGEKVLWVAIDTILRRYSNFSITIYVKQTELSKKEILEKIKNQFNLDIDENRINFVQLLSWKLTVAETYPVVRLLLQNVGAAITGLEGLIKYRPDIFVETVGYGYINPIAKLFGCHVVSYVHYPTISDDMIKRVENKVEDLTNSKTIASNPILSDLKLIYYKGMLKSYAQVGLYTNSVMTNSTWTYNHIIKLWKIPKETTIVYPPCDSSYLSTFDIQNKRERQIMSLAQFRPEKAHHVQIEAYAKLLEKHPEYRNDPSKFTKLVMIGGCRNEGDEAIVENLKSLIKKYDLEKFVTILTNLPYNEVCNYLRTSLIGIHTMKDEHFGISNIEFMASGLIILSNKSAGPLLDIVVPDENGNKTGFLASTVEEYADSLYEILEMNEDDIIKMRTCARNHVLNKFSIDKFEQGFIDGLLKNL